MPRNKSPCQRPNSYALCALCRYCCPMISSPSIRKQSHLEVLQHKLIANNNTIDVLLKIEEQRSQA